MRGLMTIEPVPVRRAVPRACHSRSGRAGVAGTRGDALLVRLHAPPVDGAANAELIAVLAAALQVSKSAITIVSGNAWRQKHVMVAGLDEPAVRARLDG